MRLETERSSRERSGSRVDQNLWRQEHRNAIGHTVLGGLGRQSGGPTEGIPAAVRAAGVVITRRQPMASPMYAD